MPEDPHFRWSHACSLGTVNPSRKLRRFESFTCHHVLRGPLTCGNAGWGPCRVPPGGGIQDTVRKSVVTAICRKLVTSANAFGRRPPSKSAGNAPVGRPPPPYWSDSSGR